MACKTQGLVEIIIILDLSCVSVNNHLNLLKFHAHTLGIQVYGF